MMTLKQFISGLETIPVTTSWYLAEISESKGRQELYAKQSPQRLESLKEHALVESTDIQRKCPGVGIDMIRRVLKDLQAQGVIECLGRGRSAKWRKT